MKSYGEARANHESLQEERLSERAVAPAEEFDLLEIMAMLRRGWLLITVVVIAAVGAAYFASSLMDPVYSARSEILIEKQGQAAFASDIFFGGSSGGEKIENILQVIHSPLVMDRAAALLNASGNHNSSDTGGRMLSRDLERVISTTVVRGTEVIQISADGPSPVAASERSNAVAKAYVDYAESRAQEQAVRIKSFLADQVDLALARVERSEEAIRDFQQDVGIIYLASEEQKLNNHIGQIEQQIMAAEISIEEFRLRLARIEEDIAVYRIELPDRAGSIDQIILELQRQQASLEAQRVDYIARGLEGSPEVRMLENRIASLEKRIHEYFHQLAQEPVDSWETVDRYRSALSEQIRLSSEIYGYERRLALLQERAAYYEDELWELSEQAFNYAKLERELDVNNHTHSLLVEELERARIAVQREMGDVQIIRPALDPTAPSSPRIRLNMAIAGVLGLFVGTGFIFLREYMDNSIKDRGQLEQLGLAMLGGVPKVRRAKNADRQTLSLLHTGDTAGVLAAAYTRIESSLRFVSFERRPKVLVISSALPSEGKSTTAVNLSFMLAHSGAKVLLVDCDLRIPVMHTLLGEPRKPGLSEWVYAQVDQDSVVRRVEGHDVGFDFIPAGSHPPSVVQLLRSGAFEETIDTLRAEYDWVIVDSAPIQARTDTLEVARVADETVLVIDGGRTPIAAVDDTRIQLEQAGATILGAVLNNHDPKRTGQYGYGYGYSYSYSYGQSDKPSR